MEIRDGMTGAILGRSLLNLNNWSVDMWGAEYAFQFLFVVFCWILLMNVEPC